MDSGSSPYDGAARRHRLRDDLRLAARAGVTVKATDFTGRAVTAGDGLPTAVACETACDGLRAADLRLTARGCAAHPRAAAPTGLSTGATPAVEQAATAIARCAGIRGDSQEPPFPPLARVPVWAADHDNIAQAARDRSSQPFRCCRRNCGKILAGNNESTMERLTHRSWPP